MFERMIRRSSWRGTEKPIFQPKLPWEQSGQYAAGTTFAEGLVWFHERWLLYYGCADSRVGVAMSGSADAADRIEICNH